MGPVCWLWAWSLCGPLLCNIHRSSGSHVSACGCNVHTCTHTPYTHMNTVQTRMYACTYRLLAPEESSHCTITLLLCHWAVTICSRFCLFLTSHLVLSVHLSPLIIPTVHLTLRADITPQTASQSILTINELNLNFQNNKPLYFSIAQDWLKRKTWCTIQSQTVTSRNYPFIANGYTVGFGRKGFVL